MGSTPNYVIKQTKMETKEKPVKYGLIQTTGFCSKDFNYVVKEIRSIYPKVRIYDEDSSTTEFNCVDDFETKIIVNRNTNKFTVKSSAITMQEYKDMKFFKDKKIEKVIYQDRIRIKNGIFEEVSLATIRDDTKTAKLIEMFNLLNFKVFMRESCLGALKQKIKDDNLDIEIKDVNIFKKEMKMYPLLIKAEKKDENVFVSVMIYTGGMISIMSNSVDEIEKLKSEIRKTTK